ncbi:MAG: hypothetical protein QG614_242 [Patescibacteria group bacterium]|nr:hypothetical protein [Patescibacteria group bacterium]
MSGTLTHEKKLARFAIQVLFFYIITAVETIIILPIISLFAPDKNTFWLIIIGLLIIAIMGAKTLTKKFLSPKREKVI